MDVVRSLTTERLNFSQWVERSREPTSEADLRMLLRAIAKQVLETMVQPGFVSANLLVSLDGCHAVNIGQFQTRQDFVRAIFRTPRVTMGFAQGFLRRLVPEPPRLRQYDLVAVSLSRARDP